jgi:hypothetical protein
VPDHPDLAQREGDEHPDDVELDELGDLGLVGDDEPAAAAARMRMPLEKASRSPRVCNWRGRKPSLARIEPSTGKPLNAVLAARMRMIPVTRDE